MKMAVSFYRDPDPVRIGKALLGRYLFTRIKEPEASGPVVTGGLIVETEAYSGRGDHASHAFGNRRTKRTEVMFQNGGVAYVYLCYGIHALFNIVTGNEGVPDAVLIRAIKPTHGIDVMLQRRNKTRVDRSLAAGPGALSRALGIGVSHSGISLAGDEIWLEQGESVTRNQVESGPRVGIQYAGKDALLPWRFRVRSSQWTSLAK